MLLKCENFDVHYSASIKNDAKKVKWFLSKAIESMTREFSNCSPKKLLSMSHIRVHVYSKETAKARAGRATLDYPRRSAKKYIGELHYFAPSKHPKTTGHTTLLGEPFDDNYHWRVLAHEYGSVLLHLICATKQKGWNDIWSAPSWFVQGYQEYIGIECSSPHARSVTKQRYVQNVVDRPEQVRLKEGESGSSLIVDNVYIGGVALLIFMHDVYGRSACQRVLKSKKDAFEEALVSELGVSVDQLYERWLIWLKKPKKVIPER